MGVSFFDAPIFYLILSAYNDIRRLHKRPRRTCAHVRRKSEHLRLEYRYLRRVHNLIKRQKKMQRKMTNHFTLLSKSELW